MIRNVKYIMLLIGIHGAIWIYSAPANEKNNILSETNQNIQKVQLEIQKFSDIGEEYLDGVRFRKVQSGNKTLYIPHVWKFSAEDFERAFCTSQSPSGQQFDKTLVRIDAEVSGMCHFRPRSMDSFLIFAMCF